MHLKQVVCAVSAFLLQRVFRVHARGADGAREPANKQ